MNKFEKLCYMGCPWFFAACFVVGGIRNGDMVMAGQGLICMSIFCLCALVAKLVDKK